MVHAYFRLSQGASGTPGSVHNPLRQFKCSPTHRYHRESDLAALNDIGNARCGRILSSVGPRNYFYSSDPSPRHVSWISLGSIDNLTVTAFAYPRLRPRVRLHINRTFLERVTNTGSQFCHRFHTNEMIVSQSRKISLSCVESRSCKQSSCGRDTACTLTAFWRSEGDSAGTSRGNNFQTSTYY